MIKRKSIEKNNKNICIFVNQINICSQIFFSNLCLFFLKISINL